LPWQAFGLVKCLQVITEPISEERLSGTQILGRLLALSANTRLGLEGEVKSCQLNSGLNYQTSYCGSAYNYVVS